RKDDKIYVQDQKLSVGSIIKSKVVDFRSYFQSLNVSGKSIVSLGLNSLLDLSFSHPLSRITLFTRQ
ncbi:MAG: hypothetical protein EXX96DRAFT_631083, partial [Benjaminiella poitrasii]